MMLQSPLEFDPVATAEMLFTDDFLCRHLSSQPKASEKASLRRIEQELTRWLKGGTGHSAVAAWRKKYSSQTLAHFPSAEVYSSQYIRQIEWISSGMAQSAVDWAVSIMNSSPELAASICQRHDRLRYMMDAVAFFLVTGNKKDIGTKKAAKRREKMFSRAFLAGEKGIQPGQDLSSLGHDELASMVFFHTNDVPGMTRAVAAYTLAFVYSDLAVYLTAVAQGADPDFIDHLYSRIPFDTPVVIDTILDHIDDLGLLERVSELPSYLDAEAAAIYSDVCADFHGIIGGIMDDAANLIAHHEEVEASAKVEIASLKASLAESEKTVSRLSDEIQSNPEIRKLEAEVARLRRQLQDSSTDVVRKERVISRLREQIGQAETASAPIVEMPNAMALEATEVLQEEEGDPFETLRQTKVLLIGGHINFVNKLRPLLPDWAYYHADYKRVDSADIRKADLVVIFHGHCNHCLFDTAMRVAKTEGKRVCYATKVNLGAFAGEVVKFLEDNP